MGIKENIEKIISEIPKDVKLIAVSKTKPLEDLLEVYNYGIRDFAENKVQELLFKEENFKKDVRWHFIGLLQTNKVKYLVDKVGSTLKERTKSKSPKKYSFFNILY